MALWVMLLINKGQVIERENNECMHVYKETNKLNKETIKPSNQTNTFST